LSIGIFSFIALFVAIRVLDSLLGGLLYRRGGERISGFDTFRWGFGSVRPVDPRDDNGVFSDFADFCDLVGEGGLLVYGATTLSFRASERAREFEGLQGVSLLGDLRDLLESALLNLAARAFTLFVGLLKLLRGLMLRVLCLIIALFRGRVVMTVSFEEFFDSTDAS
jgi:hypothetical protein